MTSVIKTKKGFDIPLAGAPESVIVDVSPRLYAVKPTDFHGIAPIPKMDVEPGNEVKAGDSLFHDNNYPGLHFTSPVSGELVEIRRGPKRAIHEVVILADAEMQYRPFEKADPATLTREEIIDRLYESGTWPALRQRPYNVIANRNENPKAIFVSCFDSAPLAPDVNFAMQGRENDLQTGINALAKLTDGDIHLGLRSGADNSVFESVNGVKKHYFDGPHPIGNVGIQIHHISPINKSDIVWTINPEAIATIGRLFNEGIYDPERVVALVGAEVKKPAYYRTRLGASIEPMVTDNLRNEHVRYISGNVLTGTRINHDGSLGFFDRQVTVIEEGDRPELFGWMIPTYPRPSVSGTFLTRLLKPNLKFTPNTNTHGEQRPFVATGEYERVLPMDILPMHLIKSILYRDYDEMEGLGIYEVVEEDLALCEFVCPSKQPLQHILREGLDDLRAQG